MKTQYPDHLHVWHEAKSGKWIVSHTQLGTNNEIVFAECCSLESARLVENAPAMREALQDALRAYDEILTSDLPALVKASFAARFKGETLRALFASIEGKE